jgi:Ricin-type beta-trefoil lectin domain-like
LKVFSLRVDWSKKMGYLHKTFYGLSLCIAGIACATPLIVSESDIVGVPPVDYIIESTSGKYLGVADRSLNPGHHIHQWGRAVSEDDEGKRSQKWQFIKRVNINVYGNAAEAFSIRNVNSNLCITIPQDKDNELDASLVQFPCGGEYEGRQRFVLDTPSGSEEGATSVGGINGLQTIRRAPSINSSSWCLGIQGRSQGDGGLLNQYNCVPTNLSDLYLDIPGVKSQRWSIRPALQW